MFKSCVPHLHQQEPCKLFERECKKPFDCFFLTLLFAPFVLKEPPSKMRLLLLSKKTIESNQLLNSAERKGFYQLRHFKDENILKQFLWFKSTRHTLLRVTQEIIIKNVSKTGLVDAMLLGHLFYVLCITCRTGPWQKLLLSRRARWMSIHTAFH